MSHVNSHNESVHSDTEDRDLPPGYCGCGAKPAGCPDCGYRLECGECGAAGRCICAEEETAVVEMRCAFGHVLCISADICRQSRESRFAIVEKEAA